MSVFDVFWEKLPSEMKRGKEQGRKNWAKCAKGNVGMLLRWKNEQEMGDFLAAAIEKQVAVDHFRISSGQRAYPHGGSWISAGRYDDDVREPASVSTGLDDDGNILGREEAERLRERHDEAIRIAREEWDANTTRLEESNRPVPADPETFRRWGKAAIEQIRRELKQKTP